MTASDCNMAPRCVCTEVLTGCAWLDFEGPYALCVEDPWTRPYLSVGSIAKEGYERRYPGMHAEHADNDRLNDLSGRVIGGALTKLNALGIGFLGKVHETAVAHDMRAEGLTVAQQCSLRVHDHDVVVGDALLLELKTVKALDDAHRLQRTNDLKASGLLLYLLLNLGRPRLAITHTAGKPHAAICVFCVHRPASALKSLPCLRRHKSGRDPA